MAKSSEGTVYWSNSFIAVAQVFLGVAAGIFFSSDVDIGKLRIVIFNLLVSGIIFLSGRRFVK